ncbi:MAG: DUF1559 domain-containing protein [Pirellulaceae bacterium]
MPLLFRCPHCGLETLVDDEFSGQSGPCAGCGKVIAVPSILPDGSLSVATGESKRSRRHVQGPRTVAVVVIVGILASSLVCAFFVRLAAPSFRGITAHWHRLQCRSNLLRIAEALRQYEVEHGSLPPAYLVDLKGKPMHSWRVLILPQLGEQGLYAQYRFEEPWDSAHNLQLRMPDVFTCPADPSALAAGETNYMVLVGPNTLFPGDTTSRTADITDDPDATILVAEVPGAGAPWQKPQDLIARRMKFAVNGGTGEIGSLHPRGAHVVMVSQRVAFINDIFISDFLEGMSTPRGGENVVWEQ